MVEGILFYGVASLRLDGDTNRLIFMGVSPGLS